MRKFYIGNVTPETNTLYLYNVADFNLLKE